MDDSDDEHCRKDTVTNVVSDKSTLPVSLTIGCSEVVIDKTSDNTELMDQVSVTDEIGVEPTRGLYYHEERDQPLVLLDHTYAHTDIHASVVEKRGKVRSPLSSGNTVTESDLDAVVPSDCMSTSVSYCSPDSGVFSKAVSDSLVISLSTVTEVFDLSTDLFKSTDDRLSVLSVSAALDATIRIDDSFDERLNNDRECQACLPTCTEVVKSVCRDADDANIMIDVTSSVMSTNTDDEQVDGAREQVRSESLPAAVAAATSHNSVKCEDEQSDVNDPCLPADHQVLYHVGDLSDSDVEDDAVLKTVVAVRTKAVDRTECVDSIKLYEPDEKTDIVEHHNSNISVDVSPGEVGVGSVEVRLSFDDLNLDSSPTEHSDLQPVNVDGVTENNSEVQNNGAESAGDSVAVALVDDGNPVTLATEMSPSTDEQLSTSSTEPEQRVTECAQQSADTSFDSQRVDDAAENDSRQLSDLIGSVKIFSEDEDVRIASVGRQSHLRTKSFTNANCSLPSSRSCSPEIPSSYEIRRHSCTLSTPQPSDIVEQVGDLSPECQDRDILHNSANATAPLTTSIEDLKLRPSKKRLEFDGLPRESSQSFFLEPPVEYRDQPPSTENVRSFMSPIITDLSTDACQPYVDLNMEAKNDHLQRYLKSLAAMPGCDSAHDVLHSHLLHEGRMHSQDDSRFGEDVVGLTCHERSTSMLMPNLLHQCDVVDELTEDERLEMQLQQYEVMKRCLMAEHRRSLEHLLAEQERQMSLLQSQLMSQTLFSGNSHHTGIITDMPNALTTASGDDEHCISNPLHSGVSDALDRQDVVNEMQISSHVTFGLDQQNISHPEHHVAGLLAGEVSIGHKNRSPAGVFYNDQHVVSRQPSCSTIRSDDTESEFAYKSPAVLRSSRRLTPSCSPRDGSKTQFDQACQNLMSTQDNSLSSAAPQRSPLHSRGPHRRYVDMFNEASLQ